MGLPTVGSPLLWIGFVAFVIAMLVLDLGVFHRRAHAVSIREATIWSAVWIGLALAFGGFVFWQWGDEVGEAYLTGYVLEKALSVDNLFVFYAVFTTFRVAPEHQHRLLAWGIVGALALRAVMILGGTWLLAHVHWVIYVFGVVLMISGWKMLARPDDEPHPERSRVLQLARKVIPTTREAHGAHFFAIEDGLRKATPLFLVLLMIEATDVVFAIDSILAVFAVSSDPFIVFTSNIFAVLGLRSLYFVLASMAQRFHYLQPGLALVLVFVGVKMMISDLVHVPVLVSLGVIVSMLGISIVASLVRNRRLAREGAAVAPPAPAQHDPAG